MWVLVL